MGGKKRNHSSQLADVEVIVRDAKRESRNSGDSGEASPPLPLITATDPGEVCSGSELLGGEKGGPSGRDTGAGTASF